jgi:predicted metal-dependent phosphoesterase TrpH
MKIIKLVAVKMKKKTFVVTSLTFLMVLAIFTIYAINLLKNRQAPVIAANDTAISVTMTAETPKVNNTPGNNTTVTAEDPYKGIDWENINLYKSNFHLHSTRSDGSLSCEELVDLYAALNYSVLAISDHNNYPSFIEVKPFSDFVENTKGILPVTACEIANVQDIQSIFCDYNYPEIVQKVNENTLIFAKYNDEKQKSLAEGLPEPTPPILVWPSTEDALRLGQDKGAALSVNHPGRYPTDASTYAKWYQEFDALISMEIFNAQNNGTGDPLQIWDDTLSLLMPGRTVFGCSGDDYHKGDLGRLGIAYNELLITDKDFNLNKLGSVEQAWRHGLYIAVAAKDPKNDDLPKINNIIVDNKNGIITLNASEYTNITWISGHNRLSGTSSLNLETLSKENFFKGYVRVELKNENGTIYLQPFPIYDNA